MIYYQNLKISAILGPELALRVVRKVAVAHELFDDQADVEQRHLIAGVHLLQKNKISDSAAEGSPVLITYLDNVAHDVEQSGGGPFLLEKYAVIKKLENFEIF